MTKSIASLYPAPFDEQFQHDFNSSVFRNGELFCYEEGKVTSIKNDGTAMFPEKSLLLGLKELNVRPDQIDLWVLPKPYKLNLNKLRIFFSDFLKAFDEKKNGSFNSWCKKKIKFVKHHNLHVYSSIGTSGWSEGLYLSIDGGGDAGDRRHFVWGKFKNGKLFEKGFLKGFNGPASFHAYITEYCGFRDQNGKLTGFSGYGKVIDELKKKFLNVLIINSKGISFERKRFNRTTPSINSLDINNYDRNKIFNNKISKTNISEICKGYEPQDIAATAEEVLGDILIKFLKLIKKNFSKERKIVFSGGLFLNVKINNLIENSKIFEKNFFPMAPSDSGLSMGGIFSQNVRLLKKYKSKYGVNPYLGPSFNKNEILTLIKSYNLNYSKPVEIERDIANEITKKKIIGIFNKRAEYGLRSLGHRSILADPRYLSSKKLINQKVKRRDWFMPFAPAILDKYYKEYFFSDLPSLYMQKAEKINKKYLSKVPAAVHVDGTSRVQYVSKKFTPFFWKLINNYKSKTGIPLILNTSFNRHGISTISNPRQAIDHLLEGCIDILYLNNFKIESKRNRILGKNHIKVFINEETNLKKYIKNWKKKLFKIKFKKI